MYMMKDKILNTLLLVTLASTSLLQADNLKAMRMPWERHDAKTPEGRKVELPMSEKLKKLWSDPVLQEKIKLGIENNRKGDFYLSFIDKHNKPVKVENLKVEMTKHDFLFGAQIFCLGQFSNEAENKKFEELYLNLFNFATLPFYWRSGEPSDGVYQFENDKRKKSDYFTLNDVIQDRIVEFCNKNGLTMKGHPLSWRVNHYGLPTWLPREEKIIEKYMCRYINAIAKKYNEDINMWDVSNEAADTQDWPYSTTGINVFPRDHAFMAFKEAEKSFSRNNTFVVNMTTPVWMRTAKYHEYASDYLLTENLISRGAKVDVIGLQLHFFKKPDRDALLSGEAWTPDQLFDVLDTYSRFNRPIHITEITFPCMNEGAVGEEKQAFFIENFYKLWFSHPKVEAIIYWHVIDEMTKSERMFYGSFIRRDFSKKPAYDVLDRLINKEWRTDLTYDKVDGDVRFRCFYGDYKVTFEANGKKYEKTVTLNKNVRKRNYIKVD